jgi:glutamate N-acetyltransferase/amino-acid N-acetyltransferase
VRFVHVGHRRREEAPHGSPASWTGPSGPGVETVEIIPDGSILSAAGFRVGAARCGIKKAEGEPDVALIVCDGPASGAGVFTTNSFAAAAVRWNRERLPADDLRVFLREAAEHTLNRVTVDGDSSTNDTAIVLASGRSGATVAATGRGAAEFREALHAVMDSLAVQIARDGEGATKLIEVHVDGAADAESAHRIARAVAESQLVKCAAYGNDPNWGRIVCAIGYSGVPVRPDSTSVHIGRVCVFRRGMPTGDDATEPMRADTIAVRIDLGAGPGEATVRTCDLSEEYVRINAEYPT